MMKNCASTESLGINILFIDYIPRKADLAIFPFRNDR